MRGESSREHAEIHSGVPTLLAGIVCMSSCFEMTIEYKSKFIFVIFQVLQVINRKISYFTSSENIIELVVFILAIIYVAAYDIPYYSTRLASDKYGQ